MENTVPDQVDKSTQANELFGGADDQASALFSSATQSQFEMPDKVEANPSTTQLVAIASSDPEKINPVDDPIGTHNYMSSEVDRARANLESNQEDLIRRKMAAKRSLNDQLRTSTALGAVLPKADPALAKQIYQSTAAHFKEDYRASVRTALEREALERAQDLAAAGDSTQAKLIINRHTPGKESANQVWNDYNVTNLALMQRYDKAKADDSSGPLGGWGAAVYTGVLNMLQPSSFSYLGSVDEGISGYDPSFLRFFFPGTEKNKQVQAFWSLPADQRLAYMDKLDANITNNATTWGVVNSGKKAELYDSFTTPTTEGVARSDNLWNTFELATMVAPEIGFVPYRALSRVASIPGTLLAAGARKEAANAVTAAYDGILKAGGDATKKATGVSGDDVVDHIMPSIINPHGLGNMPDTHISLSGEINDGIEKARETIREFNLTNTERFTTNEEITAAYEAITEKVSARFGGASVLDVKHVVTNLSDGTVTRGVEVTLGKPGGGLHGSEAEARGFASTYGYSDVGVDRIGPETRVVSHEEDGFTVSAYHGSKDTIDNFNTDHLGKATKAASAKKGVFFASPKGSYKGWSKLEWEQYADGLEKDALPFNEIKAKADNSNGTFTDFDFSSHRYTSTELTKEEKRTLYDLWWEKGSDAFAKKHYKTVDEYVATYANGHNEFPDSLLTSMIDDLDIYYKQEIKLAREADPQNAVNIAWSYARMGSDEWLTGDHIIPKDISKALGEAKTINKNNPNAPFDFTFDFTDPTTSRLLFDSDNIAKALHESGGSVKGTLDGAQSYIQEFVNDLRFGSVDTTASASADYKFLLSKLRKEIDVTRDPHNTGGTIYPVKIKGDKLKVVEGDRSKYSDVTYADEMDKAREEGFEGVVFRDARDPGNIDSKLPEPADGSYDVIAMFDPEHIRMSLSPGKVVQDTSGGYGLKVKMDIPDTAFLSNPLAPPPQGYLAKFWKNASQTSDKSVFAKAVQADSKFARFQQIIDKQMLGVYRKLKTNERMWLNQVLAKGQQAEVWFTDDQFKGLVERAMGKPPSETMTKAYHQYRLNNDIEFALRNDGVYREKVIRKYESFKFNAQGVEFDLDGVMMSGDKMPPDRVFNASTNQHLVGGLHVDAKKQLNDLIDQGYKLIRLEKNITLKDGVKPRYVLIKGSELDIRPLRRDQLGYRAGGHRLYSDKLFIKQARKGTHPDTGQEFLEEPLTLATAGNIKEARDYAKIVDSARLAVVAGKDAKYLDEVVFAGKGGSVESNLPFPSGEEFMKMMDEGRISKEHPFEAVYDRELPTAYRQGGDMSRFMDEEDMTGLPGYFRQLGQMYYSGRGEQLRSAKGGLAPVIDPFEAQARALSNVSRLSGSFSDFKTNAIERWVKTYGGDLDTGILSEESKNSPYQIFLNANVRNNTPPALMQQILGQRESIKRILGFQSEFERGYKTWLRSMSEWVIGDSDSVLRQKVGEGISWMEDKNPVGFLRGIAFDMKLGLFNVGQFFIQTSTMASALALNPKHGKFGLFSAIPAWTYFLSKGNENVLETLVKRGVHKLAGFEDAEIFKKYIREARDSGFFSLGDTHAQVNDTGLLSTFGSLGEKGHNIREMGRFFFYNAEVLNRLVAHRIAFGEAVEKFGIDQMDNFEFKELVAARSENYSFNMSGVSKAWWQHGILSVPTQFWAYNVRMIEAMTGSNFTNAQKLRLVGMNLLMAGTAGVPVVAGLAEYAKNKTGVEPDINTALGTMDRGLGDRLIYEMFGADVLVGEKWGTGTWSSDLVKDLIGMSEYNQKSFADIALGATGSIVFTTMGPVFELAKYYMTHESGSEKIDMSGEQWTKLFKNISTLGNAQKALFAYQYGVYKSNQGNALAEGLPTQDAAFIAMGIRPHEMDIMAVHGAYNNNRKEMIAGYAKQITQWRQDAFTNPSEMQETAMKVNAFVQLLPPDIRKDVLAQAHKKTDSSLYRSIEERYKKTIHKEEVARLITEEGNQQ